MEFLIFVTSQPCVKQTLQIEDLVIAASPHSRDTSVRSLFSRI